MKKFLTIFLSLMISVCCLSFVACGDKDNTNDSLIGTYKLKSMVYDGQNLELGDEAPWGGGALAEDSVVLTLNADGSLTSVSIIDGQSLTNYGTWTYENNMLTLTQQGTTGLQSQLLENGDISMSANMGIAITYVFTKA